MGKQHTPRHGDSNEQKLEGRYANYMQVGHNAFEFIFDFGQNYQGNLQTRCHTRIITSPTYAMSMLETLKSAIDDYQQNFGEIPDEK